MSLLHIKDKLLLGIAERYNRCANEEGRKKQERLIEGRKVKRKDKGRKE